MATPCYVVIANPGSKRWEAYQAELLAFWRARGVEPDVRLVPWTEVIPRGGDLDGLPAFDAPALVRLESPGRDTEVTRLLLRAGARDAGESDGAEWLSVDLPKGRLVRPGLLFRGFRRTLEGLRLSFDARPHLRPLACPLAVATMFDKNATARLLAGNGIPVPPMPPAEYLSGPPQRLVDFLDRSDWPVAYVKLATGSSATGTAVLHTGGGQSEPWAITTVTCVGGDFYNSRRLRRVTGDDLDDVLFFILREGACVQRGIPMAQVDGLNFDVRVVVVHGQPLFTVFRLSPHPMTNLHLGGRRGDWQRCRAAIPTRAWLDALDHCVEAAACFDAAAVGVDLLFERGFTRHYVLEVNAFGDFFPGWRDGRGRTVHAAEIEATARRQGWL